MPRETASESGAHHLTAQVPMRQPTNQQSGSMVLPGAILPTPHSRLPTPGIGVVSGDLRTSAASLTHCEKDTYGMTTRIVSIVTDSSAAEFYGRETLYCRRSKEASHDGARLEPSWRWVL